MATDSRAQVQFTQPDSTVTYRDDIYMTLIKDIPLLVPCFSPPSKPTTCWNDVTIEGLE